MSAGARTTAALALAVTAGCNTPAPSPEPGATTHLACGYDVRPASGAFGLSIGDTGRSGWNCHEIVVPPIPALPELSRDGLPDGSSVLVESP